MRHFRAAALRPMAFGLSLGICFFALCAATGAQPPGGPVPVRVAKIESREAAIGLPFVGTTRPRRRSVVGSAVEGRVEKVHHEEGDYVQAGAALAELRTKTIEIDLEAARAEEKLRQEELNEMQAGSREEELEAAKARLDAAKALLAYAESTFTRTDRLFQRNNAATQEEYDEALSKKLAAQFGKLAAQANYDLAVAGERPERIAQAKARLLMQKQVVARLVDRRSKYTVKAPFAGYAVSKHAEVGDWVKSGDPVIEIIELDPIEIEVTVPQRLATFLRPGADVTVQFEAIPDIKVGKIHRIVPQADIRSRSFPVRIRLDNPKGEASVPAMKAGMLAQVQLPVGKPQRTLFVQGDALVLDGRNKSVFMVQRSDKGLSVLPVPVDVGVTDGEYREVRESTGRLREGTEVVVEGNERLRPGQMIRILE